jgi:hypothetical protein
MSCSLMKHRSSGWKTFLAHLEVSLNEREGFFWFITRGGVSTGASAGSRGGWVLGGLGGGLEAGGLGFCFFGSQEGGPWGELVPIQGRDRRTRLRPAGDSVGW